MSGAAPATDIAGILAAPGPCARPSRAVRPGSAAELSCQKDPMKGGQSSSFTIAASSAKEPAAMARQETVGSLRTVYAAIELSKKSWILGIARPDRDRPSIHRLTGGDIGALVSRLRGATVQDQRIVVCYEDGVIPARRFR